MHPRHLALGAASLAAALVLAPPVVSMASTPGLAYDSLTRFQKSGDDAPQPGSFSSDFQAAAQPSAASDAPRGPFGLGRAMAQAQAALAIFKTGVAQHEYVAGSKKRTDEIALGKAEITDCAARTLTTLDLKKKTYTVTSLDAPPTRGSSGGRHAEQAPSTSDDGSKVAVAVTTKALGSKTIEGSATNGYDSDVKTTVTKPGSDPKTFDMAMTAYYSTHTNPSLACPEASGPGGAAAPGAASMMQYALAMRALRSGAADGRFSVSSSGPTLPTGKLALWEIVSMKGESHDAAFNIIMERGNIHSVSDADAVFSIPADYTKE